MDYVVVLLCRRHHRAVHEEGFRVGFDAAGEPRFVRPDGQALPEAPAPPAVTGPPLASMMAQLDRRAFARVRNTATPAWRGERLDVDWAVGVLWRPRDAAPARRRAGRVTAGTPDDTSGRQRPDQRGAHAHRPLDPQLQPTAVSRASGSDVSGAEVKRISRSDVHRRGPALGAPGPAGAHGRDGTAEPCSRPGGKGRRHTAACGVAAANLLVAGGHLVGGEHALLEAPAGGRLDQLVLVDARDRQPGRLGPRVDEQQVAAAVRAAAVAVTISWLFQWRAAPSKLVKNPAANAFKAS